MSKDDDASPMDFRVEARKHLAQAKTWMEAEDGLIYAALHLRMAIESLTYDRTHTYREFLPPEQIAAWQPRRVLEALLEIDPRLNTGASLYMGIESVPGQPAAHVQPVGTENVLSLKTIRRHYDALGSLLHTPTLKQLREGTEANQGSLRKRCGEIIEAVTAVLSSTLFNLTMGVPIEFDCRRCGTTIHRKRPVGPFDYAITCVECRAQYGITGENDTANIRPLNSVIHCLSEGCDAPYLLWHVDVKPGFSWKCEKCGAIHEIRSAIITPEHLRSGEGLKPAVLIYAVSEDSAEECSSENT